MKKIGIILGTRPEIIKLSSIIRECINKKINFFIIHTNQHYSSRLDNIFFKQLKLPFPKYNLNIGSASQGKQTGQMIIATEKILRKERPGCIIVQGDTNTVLAGAMAAAKEMNIKIAHVEAGLRSYDRTMPEEINRIVADHIADLLFAPTIKQKEILVKEGIPKEKIFVVGNTIVDAVFSNIKIAERLTNPYKKFNLTPKTFGVLTLHRPANVEHKMILKQILEGVEQAAQKNKIDKIIFPVHPRTKKNLLAFNIKPSSLIKTVNPIGYLDMLLLINKAKLIYTDSGGIQEEACLLKTPCVTLRDNTERPETLAVGGNILAGRKANKIIKTTHEILTQRIRWYNPFGSGKSGKIILKRILAKL